MSFMQRQITDCIDWYQIETTQGTWFVSVSDAGKDADKDDLAQYSEGSVESFEIIRGFGARLSAPGYLDCTEWTVFDTYDAAEEYLDEYYPDDESDEE